MPNITHFKIPTGEELPIADTTARVEIGVLQQRADDTDHAVHDLDTAVKELQDTTIHVYDSLDEVPADLPEGSFVAVPVKESAGGGGLPVVEIETVFPLNELGTLGDADIAKLQNMGNNPFILRGLLNDPSFVEDMPITVIMSNVLANDNKYSYSGIVRYWDRSYVVEIVNSYISAVGVDHSL